MNHLVVANHFEEFGNVSKTTDLTKMKEFPWFPNGNQPPSSVNVKLVVWGPVVGLFGKNNSIVIYIYIYDIIIYIYIYPHPYIFPITLPY